MRNDALVVQREPRSPENSHCGDCSRFGFCDLLGGALSAGSRQSSVICVPEAGYAMKRGDAVLIRPRRDEVWAAAAATYGLLLLCVIGSLGLAALFGGLDSDLWNSLAGLIGLAVGSLFMRLIERRNPARWLPVARPLSGSLPCPSDAN